jgi:hypothetical protein
MTSLVISSGSVPPMILHKLGLVGNGQPVTSGMVREAVKTMGFENLAKSPVYFLRELASYAEIPYTSPKKRAVNDILNWAQG